MLNKIFEGDTLEVLKTFKDKSVNCIVTSPPYFGLRNYGKSGQIGLEATPELYVAKLVEVFNEGKRVLKDDGALWLNLGDSYSRSGLNLGDSYSRSGLKPKDLIGIPWMVAFALRSAGWYLRQDIIWHKPNPMPESVTDRCTKAHEYIFLLSKSPKYYFDNESIKTELKESTVKRLSQDIENQIGSNRVPGKTNGNMKAVGGRPNGIRPKTKSTFGNRGGELNGLHSGKIYTEPTGANKRSVWTVNTKPYKEAHFATFPENLIVDCIKAGCPEGGIVLDPFMGAGTTAVVAEKLNRNWIGIELNRDYIDIAEKRLFETIL